jgi:hypothetical protein
VKLLVVEHQSQCKMMRDVLDPKEWVVVTTGNNVHGYKFDAVVLLPGWNHSHETPMLWLTEDVIPQTTNSKVYHL